MSTKYFTCILLLTTFAGIVISEPLPKPQQQMSQVPQIQQQYPGVQTPVPVHEGKSCLHTFECDAANTVLSCERGKCTCPMRPQMQWTRGTYQLNTVWDPNLRKCLSVRESACDIYNPKIVYCSPGLFCRPGSAKDGFGQCGLSGTPKLTINLAFVTIMALFLLLVNQ